MAPEGGGGAGHHEDRLQAKEPQAEAGPDAGAVQSPLPGYIDYFSE